MQLLTIIRVLIRTDLLTFLRLRETMLIVCVIARGRAIAGAVGRGGVVICGSRQGHRGAQARGAESQQNKYRRRFRCVSFLFNPN